MPPNDGRDGILRLDGGKVQHAVGEAEVRDARPQGVPVVEVECPEAKAKAHERHGQVSHLGEGAVHEASV